MPKLKFNHHELLPDDLTLVINGRRNAGKTTLLFKLLMTPGVLDYNNLMIYSENVNQFLYQFIEHGFKNKLKKDMIRNLLSTYENDDRLDEEDIEEMCLVTAGDPDNIEKQNPITVKVTKNINDFDVSKLDKSRKNLIVFDDCGSDRDQVIQDKFFRSGRHSKCACIYLTHRFHEPGLKSLRVNFSAFVFFEQPRKVLEQLTRDINLGMDNQAFYQLARQAWAKPKERNYLFINPELEERVLISPF